MKIQISTTSSLDTQSKRNNGRCSTTIISSATTTPIIITTTTSAITTIHCYYYNDLLVDIGTIAIVGRRHHVGFPSLFVQVGDSLALDWGKVLSCIVAIV